MYKIVCECGESEKNFKFNIGATFRGECCKNQDQPDPTTGDEDPDDLTTGDEDPNPADLNNDGVVDEKDAEILLSEISKGRDEREKSSESVDLDEYL